MKKLLVVAVLLAGAAIAEAQPGPPGPPMPRGKWWRGEIAQKLELNRGQQQKLDEIFQAAANELIDSKASVKKLEVALRGELDRPQLRRTEIQRIASQLSAARAKLFERELMMLVDMRGVLEDDQWQRLQDETERLQPFHLGPR
ncbi:MAG TPA: periplasmic heavy metal sensor [Thermoanaerobaculia bacterium]|jgi:Spy/CpxP family protein refolding chaperone